MRNEAHEIANYDQGWEDCLADKSKMVPFSDLKYWADMVADKLGMHIGVSIDYNIYTTGNKIIEYVFYRDGYPAKCVKFKTVQGLIEHMKSILDPPVDAGVNLEVG